MGLRQNHAQPQEYLAVQPVPLLLTVTLSNAFDRFLSKINYIQAIVTRYENRNDNFFASVQLASIRIWLRHHESVT